MHLSHNFTMFILNKVQSVIVLPEPNPVKYQTVFVS
jgi:hypothetical protein